MTEMLMQTMNEAHESASNWAYSMKESIIMQSEDMRAKMPEFSKFDVLNFDTLRDFDATQYWDSISHQGLPDRQALARVMESSVRMFSRMGWLSFLLTLITVCYLVRRW